MKFEQEANRIFAEGEGGVVAEITFPAAREGVVDIDRTFVDDSLRGQGVAGQLMEAAYAAIKADGKKAVATCSYAIKWFGAHPEKRDIVAE
jgi:predicted GNAT family acetyltransferase